MKTSTASRFVLCALLLTLALVLPPPCSAAPAGDRGLAADNLPIKVTADNMTYDTNKNTVVFTGNVEVQREKFRLWAKIITLYLKPAAQNGAAEGVPAQTARPENALGTGDLDHIVAEKNVRFHYNTQTGEADKATYTAADSVLLMEGNPIIRDGENSITGNTIRYFMNENRSEVEGGPKKRVEAVFSSNSQKKGK